MEFYEDYYDEIIIPVESKTHYKATITVRNQWFVDNTDLLIVYVTNDSGGAYQCLKKAEKKKMNILRLCEERSD